MSYLDNDAVIVDALRTPMGRSKNGCFRFVRAEALQAAVLKGLLGRNPNIDPAMIDDILCGCVNQTLEQGFNIARNAALLANIPASVPAQTINRLCGSSMSALHSAVHSIRAGCGDQYLVGGVEHMGHVPMNHGVDVNPAMSKHLAKASMMMGLTAEMLAKINMIGRERQDEFALRSQQLATKAQSEGHFTEQILPIQGHDEKGVMRVISADEVIRSNTSLTQLAELPSAFIPKVGTVTAGNSSAISDGASGLLVLSGRRADALGLRPLAKVVATSITGCDPAVMGYGPVAATKKILMQTDITLEDIDCIELNEAFAAQSLAVLQGLKLLDCLDDKVNLHGGAIALGHPLGCSGTRIITSLVHTMQQRDRSLGLATMCIGMGQGIATLIERV